MDTTLDLGEVVRRALKYIVEGFAVGLAAYFIPSGRRLKWDEIVMLALVAAATFAILDMYTPAIGGAMRTGAGFGLGANLVGFPAGSSAVAGRVV
jgi:ABC-type Co2+ transport system permease subunit